MAFELRIGLPALRDFELGELGGVRLDQLRQFDEKLRARSPGPPFPSREGGECRTHCGIDIFFIGLGEIGDGLTITGIEGGKGLSARCRTEVPVDEGVPCIDIRFGAWLHLGLAHALISFFPHSVA